MGMGVERWKLEESVDRVRGRQDQMGEGEGKTIPSLFWTSQVWVKGQHIKRHTASRALAIKSCHYVWPQLQCTWLFQMIGSGQTASFSGLKVHFCTQQMSESLYSKEMPLFCLLTYTAHKSPHRRPRPKWGEISTSKLFPWTTQALNLFSETGLAELFVVVFHSFKMMMLVLLIRHSWLGKQNADSFPEIKCDFIKKVLFHDKVHLLHWNQNICWYLVEYGHQLWTKREDEAIRHSWPQTGCKTNILKNGSSRKTY